MQQVYLILRLMAEVGSETEAREVIDSIAPEIEACGKIEEQEIERYWKIPEYYEITLSVYPRVESSLRESFDCLIALSGSGWEFGDSTEESLHAGESAWAVWNPSSGQTLLSPTVRWVHLQTHSHEWEMEVEPE